MSFLFLFLLPILSLASDLPLGEVKYLVGEAYGRGGELKIGSKVFHEETITTGKSSTLRILLEDGIAVQVGANSSFLLKRPINNHGSIELLKGFILTRIKPFIGRPKGFEVRARGVSMGVRGTTFFTKLEEDSVFLCVCEGAVSVKWAKGEEELVSKHHDAAKKVFSKKSKLINAPMGNEHSDKDLEELQKLLN